MNDEQLVDRIERDAKSLARRALVDYDNMQHGAKTRDELMARSATYFQIATALRSMKEPSDG
ncbi:hypothetical protein [Tsuneonella sp. HG222]